MDRNDERRERLGRPTGDGTGSKDVGSSRGGSQDPADRAFPDRSSSDRPPSDRNSGGGGEKGTIDKLIDRAQEKGLFGKAEKFVRDKFGGKGSGSSGPPRNR